MKNQQIPKPDETLDELDMDDVGSVDDFIRELEEKEKDLHITADLQIEIEDSDLEAQDLPDFVQDELKSSGPAVATAEPATRQQAGLKTRVYELQREVESLQEKVVELKDERKDIQEKSDQRLKDFQNYKYRMDRERRGSHIDQVAVVTEKLLPAIDNLDRALESAEKLDGKKSDDFQQFFDGIVLVNKQVRETLGGMGVEAIKTVGETFDPNFHEAVAAEDRDDMPPNTILEEMLRGYRIGNRVIRHSMVKVTTSAAPAKKPEAEAEPKGSDDLGLEPDVLTLGE
ncbi:MAG: nucleotide exchange factor GrpE [Chloracidobacterium sp.]|nr:nucleotide exchange factor GrpE [Chloracidobacterium sp.]